MVNTGHVKTKGIFAGTATRKLINIPAVVFSYLCRVRWFIFTKQIVVLFWVIIYSYLQRFFKVGVFKTIYIIHRKKSCAGVSFQSAVACYFFNKRLWRFLVYIAKFSRSPFLQEHLETSDSVFMEHVCNYNITKFNVN